MGRSRPEGAPGETSDLLSDSSAKVVRTRSRSCCKTRTVRFPTLLSMQEAEARTQREREEAQGA